MESAKSCLDCFNFKATIPLEKSDAPLTGRKILYEEATVKCRQGMLTTLKDKDRVFQHVLKGPIRHLLTYAQAERCPGFDTE